MKIWKILVYKISYSPEPYTHCKNKIEFELFLSNYAIKSNLSNKNATDVNTSDFPKKTDLASIKLYIEKLDIKELENVPTWFKLFEK